MFGTCLTLLAKTPLHFVTFHLFHTSVAPSISHAFSKSKNFPYMSPLPSSTSILKTICTCIHTYISKLEFLIPSIVQSCYILIKSANISNVIAKVFKNSNTGLGWSICHPLMVLGPEKNQSASCTTAITYILQVFASSCITLRGMRLHPPFIRENFIRIWTQERTRLTWIMLYAKPQVLMLSTSS